MSVIENRLARLESSRPPVATEYRWNEQLNREDNAHAKGIHDMLRDLGPDGVGALLAGIAINGGRLVADQRT